MKKINVSRKMVEKDDVLFVEGIHYYFNEGVPIKPIEYIHQHWCKTTNGEFAIELDHPDFIEKMQNGNVSVHWLTNMVLFNIDNASVHYCTRPMNNLVLPRINQTGFITALRGEEIFRLEHPAIKGGYKLKKMINQSLAEAYNTVLKFQADKMHSKPEKMTLTIFP